MCRTRTFDHITRHLRLRPEAGPRNGPTTQLRLRRSHPRAGAAARLTSAITAGNTAEARGRKRKSKSKSLTTQDIRVKTTTPQRTKAGVESTTTSKGTGEGLGPSPKTTRSANATCARKNGRPTIVTRSCSSPWRRTSGKN